MHRNDEYVLKSDVINKAAPRWKLHLCKGDPIQDAYDKGWNECKKAYIKNIESMSADTDECKQDLHESVGVRDGDIVPITSTDIRLFTDKSADDSKDMQCPVCGRNTGRIIILGPYQYMSGCKICGASTGVYDTPEEAIKAWAEYIHNDGE